MLFARRKFFYRKYTPIFIVRYKTETITRIDLQVFMGKLRIPNNFLK